MRHRYRGFGKYSINELDPWDGGMTPTMILAVVEAAEFPRLMRSEKLSRLRAVLRQHDEDRDLHEKVMRMVESGNVPWWARLKRRWDEMIYETDRYTSYGSPRGDKDHPEID